MSSNERSPQRLKPGRKETCNVGPKVRPPKEKEFLSDTVKPCPPGSNSGEELHRHRNGPVRRGQLRYYRNAKLGVQGGALPLPYNWQMRIEWWKRVVRGMFGGGEKRPQLCPACGALVGITAKRCHECGRACSFRWRRGARDCRNFSAGMHR